MYGLIGKKLMHSYSKEIHEILHNEKYDLVELNELDSFFQEKTFKGLNITIPYKNEVIKYCDYLSETATITQSVNSIVNNDGKIYGYNTDYDGLKYLLDFNSISLHNKTILILGNGSTSRTIQYLCLKSKAKNITVSARNPQENEVGFMDIYLNKKIDIIFNATPVGMYPNNNEELNIDLDSFENLETVIDLIYNPLLKLRQSRFKIFTTRAGGWVGRFDAPGFIITENNLLPNYEKITNDFRRYFEIEDVVERPAIQAASRLFTIKTRCCKIRCRLFTNCF